MELSESQLANGYSNRQWPSQSPVIPEGIYNTVYLGYGETLRANTEVTLSSTGYFYEIARAYTDDELSEPLLTVCNQRSSVIGGKEPLTIIIPALEHGMLGSNLHMIERFKNYNFSISGGKGGIKLMVGGIGDYNIECTPVLEILFLLNNYHVTSIWIWIYQMRGNKIFTFIIPLVFIQEKL